MTLPGPTRNSLSALAVRDVDGCLVNAPALELAEPRGSGPVDSRFERVVGEQDADVGSVG
jgi:hypothetical protein